MQLVDTPFKCTHTHTHHAETYESYVTSEWKAQKKKQKKNFQMNEWTEINALIRKNNNRCSALFFYL